MRKLFGSSQSLRQTLLSRNFSKRFISGFRITLNFDYLAHGTIIQGGAEALKGRSVLISTSDHFAAGLALIELDGIARRLVLCPPDLPPEHLPFVMQAAEVDTIISDAGSPEAGLLECSLPDDRFADSCGSQLETSQSGPASSRGTEWVLFTSGTTGRPKLVVHTLAGLTGAIEQTTTSDHIVWSTFYDIRRYGGLQIFLRAILTGASLVLSGGPRETTSDFLVRAGAFGLSHISGTPSHWRSALMNGSAKAIEPQYVRLSGEIAHQAILDDLREFYPTARVSHAFASTEAGVAFEVNDGIEGFPAAVLNGTPNVQMKLEDGSLRIRSARTAEHYLENAPTPLCDAEGFVDTGDMIELRRDRYHFTGRRDGVINVGGLKVHPEEIEAVLNRHPDVSMSLVCGKHSSFTGAVVVADVVAKANLGNREDILNLRRDLLQFCQGALARHKIPATIRFVPSLKIAETGKLVRSHG